MNFPNISEYKFLLPDNISFFFMFGSLRDPQQPLKGPYLTPCCNWYQTQMEQNGEKMGQKGPYVP